jgi:4-amino-4-deoxy-L-arabinose transferase-like glycosyltransferase
LNKVEVAAQAPRTGLLALRLPYPLLWASVAVGLLLRLVGLTRQSLWTDELYVIWEGRQPLPALLDPNIHFQHPPGYRFALHAWMGVDTSAGWIRSLPALAGVMLIPIVWLLARALWPEHHWTADIAAIFVATSPYLLHYSQDATTYSWTTFWVAISFLSLVHAWRSDQPWLWVAWTTTLTIAIYSHYLSVFPLAVEALFVAVWAITQGSSGRTRALHAAIAIVGAVVLFVPWLVILFSGVNVAGMPHWPLTLNSQPIQWTITLLAGYANPLFWHSDATIMLGWAILIVLIGSGLILIVRSRAYRRLEMLTLVACWAFAGILGPFVFLRTNEPPNAIHAVVFATMAVPGLLLTLAALLSALPPAVRWLALGAWLLLAGVQWGAEVTGPQTQDWRGILSPIAQNAKQGDALLAFTAFHAGAAAAYYPIPIPVEGGWFVGEGSDPTGAAYWFPPTWRWRGFLDPVAHRGTDWAGEFQARTPGATRLWYLVGDGTEGTYPRSAAAEQALAQAGWRVAGEWRAHPFVLMLYQRASAP